jgi:hypothetical protein
MVWLTDSELDCVMTAPAHSMSARATPSLRRLPNLFVAEAEKFRTRSLGERARKPQEREAS